MGELRRPVGRKIRQASALAFLFALPGCASLGVGFGPEAAQVRFVQVSPGGPAVDFYVNGTGMAYGMGYESFTSYLPVISGAVSLGVNRAGTVQSLVMAGGTLSGGRQYTAVVSHGPGGLQERLFEDAEAPAPAGQIAIRVLNATGGSRALTVYVTPNGSGSAVPEAMFAVPAGTASPYTDRASTIGYTVTATVGDGSLSVPVASVNVQAPSGAVRTVVFGGTSLGGGRGSVMGFVLADADAQ